jgi:ABC-2 type transport system permease protein
MKPHLRSLIYKELIAVWRDKKTRTVLFLPPLMQLFLFSYAATLEVKHTVIAIYNQDTGRQSTELIQRIGGSPQFKKVLYAQGQGDMTDMLTTQKALVGVTIQNDFSKKLLAKESSPLQVILDGRRSNASSIVLGYLSEIIEQYNTELAPDLKMKEKPVSFEVRNWFNPNLEYTWYTIPCLVAILSQVIALVLTSLSLAREREMGTFEQLMVSPLSPNEILVGKTIPALLLAMIEAAIIHVLSIYIFHIDFQGSLMLFYGSMTIFLLAVVGVGLFISSLCMTQQQAVLGTFIFMSPSMLISGFAAPIENMPPWLQYAAEAIPIKHFFIVVKGLFLKDMGAATVWQHTWPNLIIAAFTLTGASLFFKRRLG